MAERRSLVEGVNTATPSVDPNREQAEKDFVYGGKASAGAKPCAASPTTATVSRSPFSTRIRTDYTAALKRASLERELQGVGPHTLRDILEQAIEPWLKSNGYLP